jgi:hypothetical protein
VEIVILKLVASCRWNVNSVGTIILSASFECRTPPLLATPPVSKSGVGWIMCKWRDIPIVALVVASSKAITSSVSQVSRSI